MSDLNEIVKVNMIPELVRDKRSNVFNAEQIKETIIETISEWSITERYNVNVLNLVLSIIDDWVGTVEIELSNHQTIKMKCDSDNVMRYTVNGVIFEESNNDGAWYVYSLATDALFMYDRLYKRIQMHFKENPVDLSPKLKGPRDMGTFEKHIMMFETYFNQSQIRILQGFENENAEYFDEAIELGVECVANHFEHVPNARMSIKYDTMEKADKELSLFALDPENKVVGVVLITRESIFNEIERHRKFGFTVDIKTDLTKYRDKKGLHGFLFGVNKSDRKSYIAWMLMQEVLKRFSNDFDYFYGIQAEMFKSNIKYDKRAELVALIQPMGNYKTGYIYLREL